MTWITTLLQKNKLKKNSNLKKITIFIGLPLLLLGLSLYLGLIVFHLSVARSAVKFEPAKIININEPFSAKLHFNDELGTDNFTKLIVSALDSAQSRIELAMYSMDSVAITEALYRADARGVAINLIFSDKHIGGINNLFKNSHNHTKISFVSAAQAGHMHHKFLIIDRESAKPKLFFGSYNFTDIQGKYDPSFILETGRPELANIFGEEFDRLDSGIHGGNKKSTNFNPFAALIKYPEGFLEIWFSPGLGKNNIKERMIGLIKNSTNNIKIMAWNMTDKDLAAELALKAEQKPVSLITDDYNWSIAGSVFPILWAEKERENLNNLEIITDAKRNQEVKNLTTQSNTINSFLHHHLLIVDDQVAVFGTNNWGSNGFFRNDESIMVSNIPSLVQAFGESYLTNYNKDK